MKPKALIFDFFGVISSEVAPFWFRDHISQSEKRVLEEKYVRPADRGQLSQEDLFKSLGEISNVAPKEIEADWLSRAHINVDVVEYIRELKDQYRLGLLTNAFSPFFATVLERSNAKDLFEVIVMSGETGYVKPEPEMYQMILQKMEVSPEEALMIDDNPANVEGAKRIGMDGFIYSSLQGLREKIEN